MSSNSWRRVPWNYGNEGRQKKKAFRNVVGEICVGFKIACSQPGAFKLSFLHNDLFPSRKLTMSYSNVYSENSLQIFPFNLQIAVVQQNKDQSSFGTSTVEKLAQRLMFHFGFFPWLMVEVRISAFLEQNPRLLRSFISLA